MAELRLPEGPAELFEAVRETIGKYLGGEHHMRLGGGTALAARWAHRHSTEPYTHLHARREAFVREIQRRAGPLDMIRVRPLNAKILLPGGSEVTLFTSPVLTDRARSDDTVRGTNVPLESNAEILAKKLAGRMIGEPPLLARDLYDFAVARHHDPGAVKTAMKNIDTSDLRQLKHDLERLPQRWFHSTRQRPLIRPTHSEEAADPARVVQAQVGSEILSRTPRSPSPPPSFVGALTSRDTKCSTSQRSATSTSTRPSTIRSASLPARSSTPASSAARSRLVCCRAATPAKRGLANTAPLLGDPGNRSGGSPGIRNLRPVPTPRCPSPG